MRCNIGGHHPSGGHCDDGPHIAFEDSSNSHHPPSSTMFFDFPKSRLWRVYPSILLFCCRMSSPTTYIHKHFFNKSDIAPILRILEMTTSPTLSQPRTVLGPLTTTFTPPVSCGYVAIPTTSWGGSRGYQGQSCKSKSPSGLVRAVVYPMFSLPLFCDITFCLGIYPSVASLYR